MPIDTRREPTPEEAHEMFLAFSAMDARVLVFDLLRCPACLGHLTVLKFEDGTLALVCRHCNLQGLHPT